MHMFSKTALLAIAVCAFTAAGAQAQQATEINLSYKDKKFDPGRDQRVPPIRRLSSS